MEGFKRRYSTLMPYLEAARTKNILEALQEARVRSKKVRSVCCNAPVIPIETLHRVDGRAIPGIVFKCTNCGRFCKIKIVEV